MKTATCLCETMLVLEKRKEIKAFKRTLTFSAFLLELFYLKNVVRPGKSREHHDGETINNGTFSSFDVSVLIFATLIK